MDDDVQDDIDIYADLSFESHGEDENNQELKKINSKLENEINLLKQELETLKECNNKLQTNFSSLLKTAKVEISRKEERIVELRSKLDNITFRRFDRSKIKENPVHNPANVDTHLSEFEKVLAANFSYPPPPLVNTSKLNYAKQQSNLHNTIVQEMFCNPSGGNYDGNVIPEKPVISQVHFKPSYNDFYDDDDDDDEEQEQGKKSGNNNTLYGERLRKRLATEAQNEMKKKEEVNKRKTEAINVVNNNNNSNNNNKENLLVENKHKTRTSTVEELLKISQTSQLVDESVKKSEVKNKNDPSSEDKTASTDKILETVIHSNSGLNGIIKKNLTNNQNKNLNDNYKNYSSDSSDFKGFIKEDVCSSRNKRIYNDTDEVESINRFSKHDKYHYEKNHHKRCPHSPDRKSHHRDKDNRQRRSIEIPSSKKSKESERKHHRTPKKLKTPKKSKESKSSEKLKIKTPNGKKRSHSKEESPIKSKRKKMESNEIIISNNEINDVAERSQIQDGNNHKNTFFEDKNLRKNDKAKRGRDEKGRFSLRETRGRKPQKVHDDKKDIKINENDDDKYKPMKKIKLNELKNIDLQKDSTDKSSNLNSTFIAEKHIKEKKILLEKKYSLREKRGKSSYKPHNDEENTKNKRKSNKSTGLSETKKDLNEKNTVFPKDSIDELKNYESTLVASKITNGIVNVKEKQSKNCFELDNDKITFNHETVSKVQSIVIESKTEVVDAILNDDDIQCNEESVEEGEIIDSSDESSLDSNLLKEKTKILPKIDVCALKNETNMNSRQSEKSEKSFKKSSGDKNIISKKEEKIKNKVENTNVAIKEQKQCQDKKLNKNIPIVKEKVKIDNYIEKKKVILPEENQPLNPKDEEILKKLLSDPLVRPTLEYNSNKENKSQLVVSKGNNSNCNEKSNSIGVKVSDKEENLSSATLFNLVNSEMSSNGNENELRLIENEIFNNHCEKINSIETKVSNKEENLSSVTSSNLIDSEMPSNTKENESQLTEIKVFSSHNENRDGTDEKDSNEKENSLNVTPSTLVKSQIPLNSEENQSRSKENNIFSNFTEKQSSTDAKICDKEESSLNVTCSTLIVTSETPSINEKLSENSPQDKIEVKKNKIVIMINRRRRRPVLSDSPAPIVYNLK